MPKNFVGESFSLSVISGIEKINASESYVTIFRRKVFVSQYRNISYRNPSVLFQKNSGGETVYEKESGRRVGYQKFPSKFFYLTLPKNFVGEHFSLSLISGIE